MTQHQQPWSGMTIHHGDFTHILPEGEDDRTHEVTTGADCPCKPDTVGQTQTPLKRFEPPRTVLSHKPMLLHGRLRPEFVL